MVPINIEAGRSMVPINIEADRLQHLAVTFNYVAGSLLFIYLGLPLSTSNPIVQDCMPLVHRLESRFISTSIFLTKEVNY
jgi:hypothetical protein